MYIQNKILICDVSSLEYTICSNNGKIQKSKLNGINDIIDICSNIYYLNQFSSIVLIGNHQQLESIYSRLNPSNRIYLYPFESRKTEELQQSDSQQSFDAIMRSLEEIKTSLKKDSQSKSSIFCDPPTFRGRTKETLNPNTALENISNDIRSIREQTDFLIGEVNNIVAGNTHQGNNSIVEDLRKELSTYKNDFYLKSMQKYGVDIAIDIILRLYNEKNELKLKNGYNPQDIAQIDRLISYCESKARKLNLQIEHSSEGDEFDGNKMIAYDDRVKTENPEQVGQVAYSISPAFYWTLPRVNAPGEDKLLVKEEVVALFE